MELGVNPFQNQGCTPGRLDLKKHYLGSSFVAKTISNATADLKNVFYNGSSKNFSLKTLVAS